MSTQPSLTPQWKEEVNRRLAAHKNRRSQSAAQETTQSSGVGTDLGTSRAAEAAARVAARYANAPSYSQMQAEEARVAVRAAEIATKVALEAQAAAESALAELHAATQEKPSRGRATVQTIAAPARSTQPQAASRPEPAPERSTQAEPVVEAQQKVSGETESPAIEAAAVQPGVPATPLVFGIRWDPDMPIRRAESKPAARRPQEEFELSVEDWWSPGAAAESLRDNPIEVEAEQAHANLIQFPRELVATRKMRPRLAEAQAGAMAEEQLSIFEVDPASISTEVVMPGIEQGGGASICNGPEWSGIRLDTRPVETAPAAWEADSSSAGLPVASLGTRLMATVVDCALILAAFVILGFLTAHTFHHPPTGKAAELLGLSGLALTGMLYYAFFFALPACTPGMKYAQVGLCTFDNQSPTRAQLRRRLVAMLLSVLPVGLGLVWSIFDEDHLSWHDRYSRTYLRRL